MFLGSLKRNSALWSTRPPHPAPLYRLSFSTIDQFSFLQSVFSLLSVKSFSFGKMVKRGKLAADNKVVLNSLMPRVRVDSFILGGFYLNNYHYKSMKHVSYNSK